MTKKQNRLNRFGTGKIVVGAVERAVEQRWDDALARAAGLVGSTAERVAATETSFRRELTAVGAASGGAAAVPGVGTMSAIGLTAGELAWTATRTADLVLTIAAIHGHTEAEVEERKAWVLSLLAFDDDAAGGFGKTIAELGGTVTASRSVSVELLERTNGRLGRMIITRYGAERSAVIFGKLLPFGIGFVVGGVANRFLVKTMTRRADAFFAEIASWKFIPPPILPPVRPMT